MKIVFDEGIADIGCLSSFLYNMAGESDDWLHVRLFDDEEYYKTQREPAFLIELSFDLEEMISKDGCFIEAIGCLSGKHRADPIEDRVLVMVRPETSMEHNEWTHIKRDPWFKEIGLDYLEEITDE